MKKISNSESRLVGNDSVDSKKQQAPKRIRVERSIGVDGETKLTKIVAVSHPKKIQIDYIRNFKKGYIFGCELPSIKYIFRNDIKTGERILTSRIKGYLFSDMEHVNNGIPIGDVVVVCENNILVKITAKKAVRDLIQIDLGVSFNIASISKKRVIKTGLVHL